MNVLLPNLAGSILAAAALVPDLAAQPLRPDSQPPAGTTWSAPAACSAPRIPVHTRAPEPGQPDYGIWGAGRSYKAGFAEDPTFVPALGPDYPHNQPLAWRTESVRLGDRELLVEGRKPTQQLFEFRVERDHGAVLEAYDLLEDGLEQTFLLREAPTGTGGLTNPGDLTIRGRVFTGLSAAERGPAHAPILFHDADGLPIVSYGAAVAIDAKGTRFPMQTAWSNGSLELRLGADAVACARFPLLVDPLFSAVRIGTGNLTAGDVAIEDESTALDTLLCYTWHFSATDDDVVARLTDSSFGGGTYSVFSDLSTNTSTDHPRTAFVAGTDRWVIAYQSLLQVNQVMQIRVHLHQKGDPAHSSTSIGRLNAPGDHDWRPVVGGTYADSTGDRALIVFQRDDTGAQTAFADTARSAAMALLFNTTTAAGSFGVPFTLYASPDHDAERPTVNRHEKGGTSFAWMAVCQIYNHAVANDDWDLVGVKVDQAGRVGTGKWFTSVGHMHQMAPVVDGRDGRYCVAFSALTASLAPPADAIGRQIYVERVEWRNANVDATVGLYPATLIVSSAGRLFQPGGIAFNGESRSHWTLAYRWTAGSTRATLAHLGSNGREIGPQEDLINTTGSPIRRVAAAHGNRMMHTACSYDVHGSGGDSLFGRTMAWNTRLPEWHNGQGCNNVQLSWYGPATRWPAENRRIGGDQSGVLAVGATDGSLHLLLVGTTNIALPIHHPLVGAGCQLLVPSAGPGHVVALPSKVGGTVTWNLPMPEYLLDVVLCFQDWVLDPGTGLLTSTSALDVPLFR